MSPKKVERLQRLLSIYFMHKQSAKAIYRENRATIDMKLGRVKYLQADSIDQLKQILQSGDVIYSKNEVLELTTLNWIGVKKLPPIILGVHTPIFYPNTPSMSAKLHNILYTGLFYKYLIKHIKSIQVNNEDDRQFVKQKLKYNNVKVLPQAFTAPKLNQSKQKDGDILNILFVGRLTEAKGIELLIQIAQALKALKSFKFSFKIAGSGEAAVVKSVETLASEVKEVQYLGHVQNQDIGNLYDWCDVTLITSQYETLNKVAVETALAGKIAVCADLAGPREVIKDNVTGYLLPREVPAFINRLKYLADLKANDPQSIAKIGSQAYEFVSEKFSPDNAYAKFYEDVSKIAQGKQQCKD